jgi:hypothetical protein
MAAAHRRRVERATVIREAGAFGIDVHVIARRELPPAEPSRRAPESPDLAEITW